jgi:hypothetical protein
MSAAHDLFFLAHYAYNILNPLVDEAKAIEPSTVLYLDLGFGDKTSVHHKVHRLSVNIHWGRGDMLAMSPSMANKTDVDLFADALRGKIDKLAAPVTEDRRIIEDSLASI